MHIQSRHNNSIWEVSSIKESCSHMIQSGWNWSIRLLNKHTDLISSLGILSITTCLLAAKIFKSIPSWLPRIANIVFSYGGIIWLNVQVRDFTKSCRDWKLAAGSRDLKAMVETAAKILVKGVNILLTCAIFTASVVASVGLPQATLVLQLTMRPLALTSLAINIISDVRDYYMNERLLKNLEEIESKSSTDRQIAKVMTCFLEIITSSPNSRIGCSKWMEERRFAENIIRQLDTFTLETMQERFSKPRKIDDVRQEAFRIFYAVQDSMRNKQVGTKANLFLTGLGYVSMAICKAYPETILEKSTRWGMSMLYTDELIRQKLFQADLAQII